MSQAEIDQILALVYSADTLFRFDSTATDILLEEAAYYFNGSRTAAETAAIIQDRMQTYLAEQG